MFAMLGGVTASFHSLTQDPHEPDIPHLSLQFAGKWAHDEGSKRIPGRRFTGSCLKERAAYVDNMGMASEDLLITLQILPGFFSNCLFLALYDSVVLVRRVVSRLSCSRSAGPKEWRPMLTSAGLRSIWNSFLLDAYKQVSSAVYNNRDGALGGTLADNTNERFGRTRRNPCDSSAEDD